MARSYFATRISENISKTPEGYLLCLNVPMGRTGWQEYLGREIVSDGSLEPNKVYRVYRSEAEVFAPASLASFEGKSICDGHPAEWLDASNDRAYSKGHSQNVRRGEGEDDQAAVSDLIIKDAVLISKIENGLREVSLGYNMEFEPQSDGTFLQKNIRGNHIAIVPSGRAGERIAIKDELPKEITKGAEPMTIKERIAHIMALGFKAYAKDAEPAEVAATMEAMKEKGKDAEVAPETPGEPEHVKMIKELVAAVAQIGQRLEALEKGEAAEKGEQTSLDALETELTTGQDCNAAKDAEAKAEAEKKAAADAEAAAKVIEPGKEAAEKKGEDSKAAILAGIRAMKPIIAAIADPAERKRATDSLAAAFRSQIGVATATDKSESYADLGKGKHQAVQDSKKNSEPKYGDQIAASRAKKLGKTA